MGDHGNASLVRSAIFEGIPSDAIDDLCGRGRPVSYGVGHKIFERGQIADELLILRDGIVELLFPVQIMGVTRELTMESKQDGDVVAWSALVSPYHFTLSARCASDCSLTALNRRVLYTYFETNAHIGYLFMRNLAGVIGRRLQSLQINWINDLQASALKRLG